MTDKPLISIKQKISFAFYIVFAMTLGIGIIALLLSQELKNDVDSLINEDFNKINLALKLAKESQRLKIITTSLENESISELVLNQQLAALTNQWSQLIKTAQMLAKHQLVDEKQELINHYLETLQQAKQQMPVLEQLTLKSANSRKQTQHIHDNFVILQHQFSHEIQTILSDEDDIALATLSNKQYQQLKITLEQHNQLSQLVHIGEALFANISQLAHQDSIPNINKIQRTSMRLFIKMQEIELDEKYQSFKLNWLHQIKTGILGQNNIFEVSREVINSHRIAKKHLNQQAETVSKIDKYTQHFVSDLKRNIYYSSEELKADSTAFMILVFIASFLYTIFIWLTNWHFISKGIIKPVIATSNAMKDIANEKLDTTLPQTDNLELQQMVNSLETLKTYAAQVKAISEIDGLTGAYNRRFFDIRLEQQIEFSYKNKQALSIVLFDLDQFKQYNDHYGHIAGDRCLQQVVEACKRVISGEFELIARYGGEEFVMLLPACCEQEAFKKAENLRLSIFQEAIAHEHNEPHKLVTVSLGVTTYRGITKTKIHNLLKQADTALYTAKQTGRNCTKMYNNIHEYL
ncbi:GGDEF domain-containing protein [Shewanella marina]|uniref:GGDEF domain-containing protein n=1 Tax=Shewanella marina TaxID=487319 RepID=UPI000472C867|nr:GGDEF domain-containing protein [Shewanella marina]